MKSRKVAADLQKVSTDEKKWVEQQRDNFLAMVTHDFKAPLTVIMGYTELIAAHKGLDGNLAEMCGYILKNGEKLLGMVDDFTFHVKLQSGALTPEFAFTDLNAILREANKGFSVQASKKSQIIETELADDLPQVFIDRRLVERAVNNLLQNAVNYTPKGGRITLKSGYRTEGDSIFPVISVSDSGPGIPAEQISQLFDMYFRSQNTRGVRGAGLGLTIVKAVAEAHGGHVEVESKLGKGSTFHIYFPPIAVNLLHEHSATAAV